MNTFTGAIGTGGKWLLDRIVGALAATGINPNLLTFLGLVVNFGAAASFAVAAPMPRLAPVMIRTWAADIG